MENKTSYPSHFWAIHKKVYNREWNLLDGWRRRAILNGHTELAKEFYDFVMGRAVAFFNDENHNYNSRFRFQYDQ